MAEVVLTSDVKVINVYNELGVFFAIKQYSPEEKYVG
jgi:hypothetical protein